MPRWLEFHDSEFVTLTHDAEAAVIALDGYVHDWEQLATGWTGTGWIQRIRITVDGPTVSVTEPTSTNVDDEIPDVLEGALRCGSVAHEDVVPLPFAFDGAVQMKLSLNCGRVIEVSGIGIRIEPHGDAEFVEDLTGRLEPPDSTWSLGRQLKF